MLFSIFITGRNELELKFVIVRNDTLFFVLHAVIPPLSVSVFLGERARGLVCACM